jgi:small-conductance mechanosensitive channel
MNRLKILFADTETLGIFGAIVLLTILFANLISRIVMNHLIRKSRIQGLDVTGLVFVRHIVNATIYLFGFAWAFLSLPISKNYAHSLFAGAGVSTLILGFASQQVLSNVMSGVMLILKRPFRINDMIEIQGNRGKVIELDLHATTIEDENKNRITIPNSLISNGIIKNIKQGESK